MEQTVNPELAAALAKAQSAFEAATKGKANPAFKSRYADLQSVVDAVRPALNSAGIWLMQDTVECGDGVTVETVFVHASGATLRAGRLHVPVVKHDPQGYGSALTYARRYSLMTACGIAPEDDDGNAASQSVQRRAQPATPQPAPQEAIAAAEQGMQAYQHYWRSLNADQRRAMEPHHSELKAIAQESDAHPKEAA